MAQKRKFPFRLRNAFFAQIEVERPPKLPEQFDVGGNLQARVNEKRLPDVLEIQVRLETPEQCPLLIHTTLVGIFDLVEDAPEPIGEAVEEFVAERALHVLWSYLDHMITQVTAQMGMNPIRLNPPDEFAFDFPSDLPGSAEAVAR